MPKLKCVGCKNRFDAETMIGLPIGNVHSIDCATAYAQATQQKQRDRQIAKDKREIKAVEKADRVKLKTDKERIKKRTGKNGYYQNLKTMLHYYVKHVLRKGEPCYTCGQPQRDSDSPQAFHAGHFIPAKEVDPRRFMLENLRIQCYACNVPNSGRRAEYRKNLIDEMGLEHVEWLECEVNHKSLKEQYPTVESIKAETAKYRALSKV